MLTININYNRIFEDADAFIALAENSFAKAAKKAVAENNRFGIPAHGSIGSKLVVRQPNRKYTSDRD